MRCRFDVCRPDHVTVLGTLRAQAVAVYLKSSPLGLALHISALDCLAAIEDDSKARGAEPRDQVHTLRPNNLPHGEPSTTR